MKYLLTLFLAAGLSSAFAQTGDVQTVFSGNITLTGYGAVTTRFTTIRGEFANLTGGYGGVYFNHRLMVGAGAYALTTNLGVPVEYRTDPTKRLSYEYGQVGMVTEYVVNSDKAVHLAFNLFAGGGFTVQYLRHPNTTPGYVLLNDDEDWFFVIEPGVQMEVNLFRWMRFSPGVSYRGAIGVDGYGLSDRDLSNLSYNLTFKFGKF